MLKAADVIKFLICFLLHLKYALFYSSIPDIVEGNLLLCSIQHIAL